MERQPQPEGRGLRLLAVHLRSLDPSARTPQERLEDALGAPLARKLLFALAPSSHSRRAA